MRLFTFAPAVVSLLFVGCASQQLHPTEQDMLYAKYFASKGDFKAAFWKMREPVGTPTHQAAMIDLAKTYPQIVTEGKARVTPEYYASLAESGETEAAARDVRTSLQALKILLSESEYGPLEQRANKFLDKTSILQVRRSVWEELSDAERTKLQEDRFVSVKDDSNFGRVIDRQLFDASTNGTTAGSQLGAVLGQAQYVDNSIPKGTYSATGQVGAAILGAVIGSSLDQSGSRTFVMRYAIKRLDGKVSYADRYESTSLGESIGVCVNLQAQQVDQDICELTAESLRAGLLKPRVKKNS